MGPDHARNIGEIVSTFRHPYIERNARKAGKYMGGPSNGVFMGLFLNDNNKLNALRHFFYNIFTFSGDILFGEKIQKQTAKRLFRCSLLRLAKKLLV